ncbi:MAG: hypothetical protein M1832_005609, partial [Thelocarpon impressellum]
PHGRADDDADAAEAAAEQAALAEAERAALARLDDEQLQLRDMQRFLNGLARRDDIPDEWWAAAGLRRDVGE